ncbi:MAG: pyrimidine dimer DNA glycosylase/endonuclease V [Nitrospiraceae bacterium]|nr:pyrimidine dimer DNA glycosylase/endonuclease V [Nitrospiraceae bacterium]
MRLWTIHPKYLDRQGLTALWREALLARAVLLGETKGYRSHPQLERFRECSAPLIAINSYLSAICAEASERGYSFNKDKLCPHTEKVVIRATSGQLFYEWQHLLAKLKSRSPEQYEKCLTVTAPESHPLFKIVEGSVAKWERIK